MACLQNHDNTEVVIYMHAKIKYRLTHIISQRNQAVWKPKMNQECCVGAKKKDRGKCIMLKSEEKYQSTKSTLNSFIRPSSSF